MTSEVTADDAMEETADDGDVTMVGVDEPVVKLQSSFTNQCDTCGKKCPSLREFIVHCKTHKNEPKTNPAQVVKFRWRMILANKLDLINSILIPFKIHSYDVYTVRGILTRSHSTYRHFSYISPTFFIQLSAFFVHFSIFFAHFLYTFRVYEKRMRNVRKMLKNVR